MDLDWLKDQWEDLRENWDNPYWRLDHPELMVLIAAIVSGVIGLAFAVVQTVLQTLIERRLADG